MSTKKVENPCEEIPPYLLFAYYYSKNEMSEITIINLICYRINRPSVFGRQPVLDEIFVKLTHHPEVLQKERITFAISPRV